MCGGEKQEEEDEEKAEEEEDAAAARTQYSSLSFAGEVPCSCANFNL